jgi:hypothetical protein
MKSSRKIKFANKTRNQLCTQKKIVLELGNYLILLLLNNNFFVLIHESLARSLESGVFF